MYIMYKIPAPYEESGLAHKGIIEGRRTNLELAQVAGSRVGTLVLSDPQRRPLERRKLTSSLNPPSGTGICLCVDLPIHTHTNTCHKA